MSRWGQPVRGDLAPDEGFRARLEDDLAKRHRSLYQARHGRPRRPFGWRHSPGLVAGAILVAAVAAAAAPVRLTLGLGQVVTIELPSGTRAPDHGDLLLHLLDARSGADQVSASVDSGAGGDALVLLLLFGERIDAQRLRADLERAFPELSAGRWRIQALEADLRTSLARLLGHRLLALEPDPGTLERRRRLVVDQLTAPGWKGEVSFEERDGIRVIEVRAMEGGRGEGR